MIFDPSTTDRARALAGPGPRAAALLAWILLSGALFVAGASAEPAPLTGPPSPVDLPVAERFVSPVGDPTDYELPAPGESQGYALTRGVQRTRDRHLGLDLSNRQRGGEVRAPADGVVIESRRYAGWGQLVVIAHRMVTGECVMSLLAHLQPGSVSVKPGDRVVAGQPLAAVGQSGHATGPHLHFELRELGHADPWRTLWERAPVLDPLRVLGRHLGQALFAGPADATTQRDPGAEYLRRLCFSKAVASRTLGNPEAPLTRLEFYAWLDAASRVDRGTAPSSWNRVRHRMAASGITVPSGQSIGSAPVTVEEAERALSRLLSADGLARVAVPERVGPGELRRRGLPSPAPSLSSDPAWTVGPAPTLTRGDGALLVLAARSWPFAASPRP